MKHTYYTLIASLPRLVRFDRAEHLPINVERFRERQGMLDPKDLDLLREIMGFVAWHRLPLERTDAEMVAEYDRLIAMIDDPVIAEIIQCRVDMRTIIAALRRRKAGLPAPAKGERWGAGRRARHIADHWDEPHFGLEAAHPWIPQARDLIERGETLALERLLFSINWDTATRLVEGSYFGFDVVLAYLFKWDMVRRWLVYDVDAAGERFNELVGEAMHGCENLFG